MALTVHLYLQVQIFGNFGCSSVKVQAIPTILMVIGRLNNVNHFLERPLEFATINPQCKRGKLTYIAVTENLNFTV